MKAPFALAFLCGLLFARGGAAQTTALAPPPHSTVSPELRILQQRHEALQAARQLEQAAQVTKAFQAYLAIPGAEHLAAALLRRDPAACGPLLETALLAAPTHPSYLLLKGEGSLATGDKVGALQAYRHAARVPAPSGAYFVEPPPPTADSPHLPQQLLIPFSLGPGSHRDNWLLRRFIALEAWDDASTEFARIQAMHRTAAGDGQYTAQGLQFALDHAFFLQRRERTADALNLLQDAILRIDLDRRPPYAQQFGSFGGFAGSSGIARREFIRLAYGQFKAAAREPALITAVQARIDAGHNPARRLMARLLLHQQKPDDALALELMYIEKATFNPLSTAIRRGSLYDDFKKLPEAAAAYEKALAMPPAPLQVPDPDEPDRAGPYQQMPQAAAEPALSINPAADLLHRLQRLYSALGRTDQLLQVFLRQLELETHNFADDRLLQQASAAFQAAGQQDRFSTWVKNRLAAHPLPPATRANLCAVISDIPGLISALADAARAGQLNDNLYDEWRRRMQSRGEATFRSFLTAIVEAAPRHTRARLDLLNLQNQLDGPAAVAALEAILEGDAPPAFARYKGSHNSTEFRSYFDLAYRLMRLYEKQRQHDRLVALGLRIARGDKPFAYPDLSPFTSRDFNDVPEHANAALALAIAHADETAREALAAALRNSPWEPARNQLARLRAPASQPAEPKPFGWANLPPGVQLLAANENVLALARDAQYLFAGHPWGVAIYRHDGTPVTRVAIEDAALSLCVMDDALWVGGAMGLHRVDLHNWSVAYMPCDQDVTRPDPDMRDFYNGVCAVARDADLLWIGTRRNIRSYNPATRELRIYSQEDLGLGAHADWNRFLFTDDAVWAASNAGLRRFDRHTRRWDAPTPAGDKPVTLIGLIDGQLWGEVWLNDQLRARPALIDARTLAVTPILIEAPLSPSEQMINGPWTCLGRYQGKVLFSANNGAPGYIYDERLKKLKPLPRLPDNDPIAIDSPLPPGLRSGKAREDAPGLLAVTDDMTHLHELYGQPFHAGAWTMLKLPNGTWALGGSHSRSPRYIYPRDDWPFELHVYQTPDGSGGLHLLTPQGPAGQGRAEAQAGGRRRHISSGFADTLFGDNVFAAVQEAAAEAGAGRTWLCTEYGVSVLDAAGRVAHRYSGRDGLLGNRISGGAALGGKLYFASRHDDSAGGLIVFDPATRLFTSLLESDGLASGALETVERQDEALKLVYGVEYRRFGDYRYHIYSPGTFTPAAAAFSPRLPPEILSQSDAVQRLPKPPGEPLPLLGGSILARQTIGGRTFLCGTRGVVIREGDARVTPLADSPARARLAPIVVYSPDAQLRAQALQRRIAGNIPPERLGEFVGNPNPYIVADAIAAAMASVMDGSAAHVDLIAPAVKHAHRQVRSTALLVLSRSKLPSAIPPLRAALEDQDPALRAHAAVALARHGQLASLSIYEDILSRREGYGNLPYGAASAMGGGADHESVYTALAPIADARVLELFLRYAPRIGDYDHEKVVYPQLGAALRRHPEALPAFLQANTLLPTGDWNREFAWRIIGLAGPDMLPALHDALKSTDRVVRHNAARACGIIGDPASIPLLIAALNLESGLSRAGIAWALGELRATDALPHLASLYVDALNDSQRRAGSGFRAQQAAAVMQDQYTAISTLDSIGHDWDELKASLRPRPLDPVTDEPLLTPEFILEAVRKIGPDISQDFYRALAGSRDLQGRLEAARQLGAAPAQRDKNLPILRNLLADPPTVRLAAAVSLVLLQDDAGRAPILAALAGDQPSDRHRALQELQRARGRLDFAREQIAACAADPTLSGPTRQLARELLR